MKKIKVKDQVVVVTGQDKGKVGEVRRITGSYAEVSGVNTRRKGVKNNPQQRRDDDVKDGFKLINAPIHLSNLALQNVKENRGEKVKFFIEGKIKRRIFKKTGEIVTVV